MENEEEPSKPNVAHMLLSTEEVLSLPVEELMIRLSTSASSLTHEDADLRLVNYDPNELAKKKKYGRVNEECLRNLSAQSFS